MNIPRIPLILLLAATLVGAAEPDAAALAARGEFAAAAAAYLREADAAARKRQRTEAAMAWCNAATCMKMTGDLSAAALHVKQAEEALPADCPARLRLEVLALKGSVGALGKRPWEALPTLQEAARLAANSPALRADVLNDLGIVHSAMGAQQQAAGFFTEAAAAAAACGESGLVLRARQNHVIATFQAWQTAATAFAQEDELKTADEKAFDALAARSGEVAQASRTTLALAAAELRASLARAGTLIAGEPPSLLAVHLAITTGLAAHRHGWQRDAFGHLRGALAAAGKLADRNLQTEALLGLAELYLDARRPADALKLLVHARRTQLATDPVQVAKLELLSATSHMALSPLDSATAAAVLRAVAAVGNVRSDIARTQGISDLGRPFRERAGQPYLLLADLALQLAEREPARALALAQAARDSISAFREVEIGTDGRDAATLLARNAVEAFKAWELQDFYRDDCVNVALAKRRSLDHLVNSATAVLYVIPFPDRVEILLGHGGRLHRATSRVAGPELLAQARRLRARIQWNDGVFLFLDEAEALYDEMIRPLAGVLAAKRIRHLVFVPDGALASLPLGVLRDRQRGRFLVEDYSISVAPGLAMVPSEQAATAPPVALLAGYTLGADGFPPLPAARAELAALAPLYPRHQSLLDAAFSKDAFAAQLRTSDTTLIHLATHGEFLGRADQTFLLCEGGRITLDELEQMIQPKQFRGHPVDLLCLSACKTAAGDDRAALGLAGSAVKSGSRSVLATLWQVDDAATSGIMTAFHTRLCRGGVSKAEILRQAQLDLMRQEQPFTHPSLWAPFILVGDWQ